MGVQRIIDSNRNVLDVEVACRLAGTEDSSARPAVSPFFLATGQPSLVRPSYATGDGGQWNGQRRWKPKMIAFDTDGSNRSTP